MSELIYVTASNKNNKKKIYSFINLKLLWSNRSTVSQYTYINDLPVMLVNRASHTFNVQIYACTLRANVSF